MHYLKPIETVFKAIEKAIKKIMHLQKSNQNFSNTKFEKSTSTTLTQWER